MDSKANFEETFWGDVMDFFRVFVLDKAKDTNKDALVSKGKVAGKQGMLWLSWHHGDIGNCSTDIVNFRI